MIRWRWEQPRGSGRRTGWAKTFDAFDPELRGAKAFTGGAYLDDGVLREDPEGALVVQVSPVGSAKHGSDECQIFKLTPEGLEPCSGAFDWSKDWLAIKDAARALLAASADASADASTDASGWVTFRCEKCGRRMQLEASDLPLLDDGIACPYHMGATYWLRREGEK